MWDSQDERKPLAALTFWNRSQKGSLPSRDTVSSGMIRAIVRVRRGLEALWEIIIHVGKDRAWECIAFPLLQQHITSLNDEDTYLSKCPE